MVGPTVTQEAVTIRFQNVGARLIKVKEENFRKANREMVRRIVENLGVPVSQEAMETGLEFEQPCRLERVGESKLVPILGSDKSIPKVFLDICHNP